MSTQHPDYPPCPVEWCDEVGRHPYSDEIRVCRHETGQNTAASIGAEVYGDETGIGAAVVTIGQGASIELDSPYAVAQYLGAIVDAAALAFPQAGAMYRFDDEGNVRRAVFDIAFNTFPAERLLDHLTSRNPTPEEAVAAYRAAAAAGD